MTEKDKQLIKEANETPCWWWTEIESLIEKAESQEAKEELKQIEKYLRHKEEYYDRNL